MSLGRSPPCPILTGLLCNWERRVRSVSPHDNAHIPDTTCCSQTEERGRGRANPNATIAITLEVPVFKQVPTLWKDKKQDTEIAKVTQTLNTLQPSVGFGGLCFVLFWGAEGIGVGLLLVWRLGGGTVSGGIQGFWRFYKWRQKPSSSLYIILVIRTGMFTALGWQRSKSIGQHPPLHYFRLHEQPSCLGAPRKTHDDIMKTAFSQGQHQHFRERERLHILFQKVSKTHWYSASSGNPVLCVLSVCNVPF